MLVSIIMPAYNASETIKHAIDSVLEQTYADWELIVVNDCSADETEKIIKEYTEKDNRIKLISNEKNKGVSVTRKIAVEQAKGDWIAFLDSDDAWEKEKLEKQVKLLRDRDAKLVFTGSAFMDSRGQRYGHILHVPEKMDFRQLLKQNLISNSSVMIMKTEYEKHRALKDDIHEDFACWLSFLKEGNIAYGIDEPLLIYRISAGSKSGNKLKAAKMNWKTYSYIGISKPAAIYNMFFYTVRNTLKYVKIKNRES